MEKLTASEFWHKHNKTTNRSKQALKAYHDQVISAIQQFANQQTEDVLNEVLQEFKSATPYGMINIVRSKLTTLNND